MSKFIIYLSMPKAVWFASIIGVAMILGGLGYLFLGRSTGGNASKGTTDTDPLDGVTVNDPAGVYKPYTDSSISRGIARNTVWGNGQTLSLDYDGSKTTEDGVMVDGDLLFQTYYVGTNGSVYPMGGGVFVEGPKGTYTNSDRVYTSAADGRPGFIEVTVVQGSSTADDKGRAVNLGMFPIKFQVAE